ncbi:MAG: thioredoxin domain-containing protein, partial [Prevotella sp.]|nr:thioredoxin domain-containing protein [Prevotella sp.]
MGIKSSLISLFTYVMLPTLFVCTSCKRGGGNTSSSREMQVTKTAKDHSENVVKSLTTEQFTNIIADINNDGQWKYKGNRPAVIDFYATWCQPCRMMAPEFEAVAKEYQGKVDFFRV